MASLRAALSFVESAVKTHNVVVFSKTTCPFSILAKKILTEAGVQDMKVFEIERREDASEIQVRRNILFFLCGERDHGISVLLIVTTLQSKQQPDGMMQPL